MTPTRPDPIWLASRMLRLAARERLRAAIEREIIEPDVAEKRETVGDLAHQPLRDLATPAFEPELSEETARVRDRSAAMSAGSVPRRTRCVRRG